MLNNIYLVAQREFLVNVRKRSFLFAVFGMPIMMGIIFAIVILATLAGEEAGADFENSIIGYVDNAGVIAEGGADAENFIAYETDEAARAALDAEEITVYFILPQLYMANGAVRVIGNEAVGNELENAIEDFIVASLSTQVESDVPIERIQNPVDYEIFMESTQRMLSGAGILGLFLVPVLFIVIMVIGIQLSSTFLMSGVVEEKTNHIMEILITSVKPIELLAGKVIGLSLLGLVQLGVWIGVAFAVYLVAGDTEFLSAISIPFDLVVISLTYFLLTYLMFASILAGIGSVVGGEQESRQYASIVSILLFAPMFVFQLFLTNPTSPVITAMTYIPFTSAMTYMLKSPFAPVPYWQVAISLAVLAITTLIMIWASAKVFRWGILLEGKKINLSTLFKVIFGSAEAGTVPTTSKGSNS